MDGFVSVARFQSLSDPDKLLSLSFWWDEPAVAAWRCHAAHRATRRPAAKLSSRIAGCASPPSCATAASPSDANRRLPTAVHGVLI
jgi:heme-degrading monooxygenase HmoA